MNIVFLAQIIGVISIFLIFCLEFYIAIVPTAFVKAGRAALLWFSIYVFFLFVLRGVALFNLATPDQLRIVSGFSTLIPLIAIAVHLFLGKKLITDGEKKELLEEQI